MATRRFRDPRLESVRRNPHVCLAEGLRSANRAIARRYAAALAPTGLGPAQLSLLMRLYYLGPTPMARLAYQMETDRTTLTRTVKLLTGAGHVEITPGKDRRARLVAMTETGFAVLVQAIPLWQQVQADLQGELGAESWSSLLRETRHLVAVEGLACERKAGRERRGG